MKKNYLILFTLLLGINVNAQCPLTTAVDFTATDIDGQQHNLFSYLNSNKYVLIDFFYTTCVPCQQNSPKVQGAYEHFGCNSSNVIFLSIDQGNNNAEVLQFENTYGIHCPGISGVEGGGTAITTTYGIGAFPTVILIAPDKTLLENDIWPIADAAALITKIESHGGIAANCTSAIFDNSANKESRLLSVFPNPISEMASITLELKNKSNIQIIIYNLLGEKLINFPTKRYSQGIQTIQLTLNSLKNGSYFIQIIKDNVLLTSEKIMIIK